MCFLGLLWMLRSRKSGCPEHAGPACKPLSAALCVSTTPSATDGVAQLSCLEDMRFSSLRCFMMMVLILCCYVWCWGQAATQGTRLNRQYARAFISFIVKPVLNCNSSYKLQATSSYCGVHVLSYWRLVIPECIDIASQVDTLYAGEVGYLAAQIKSVQDARVGDTVTLKKAPAATALEGYEDVQPMVYCGLFPTDADDYQVRAWVSALLSVVLPEIAQ